MLAWTILSYILAAAMQAFIPSVIPFFPAVRDFAAVFAMAGVAYAAERVEQQARIDWRASLVVLVRGAGALVLLGLPATATAGRSWWLICRAAVR